MNPYIAAAWIAAGVGALGIVGTVITSVVSSRNTRRTTEQAIAANAASTRATLLAAHDAWLRDRRASAYEVMLTTLLHRQAQRHFDLRKYRVSEAEEKRLTEFYENYELPGMFETQSHLVAYATDTVMDAFNVSRGAHATVKVAYSQYDMLSTQIRAALDSGRQQDRPDTGPARDAQQKLDAALKDADAADDALMTVIREELRRAPEAAMQPPDLPATRRGIWRRRRG